MQTLKGLDGLGRVVVEAKFINSFWEVRGTAPGTYGVWACYPLRQDAEGLMRRLGAVRIVETRTTDLKKEGKP